jgi:hypothetical protein
MSTQRQIDANRLNAQHSTGPTTPEGKAITSQNALKSGIDAESLIIRTEDPAQYQALSDAYYVQFAPTTEHERALVDILISSEWLRRRYLRVESRIWNSQLDSNTSLSAAYAWTDERLARVDRRLNSALRSYTHALKQLEAINSKKRTQSESAPPSPAPTASPIPDVPNEQLSHELGQFPISENPAPPTPDTIALVPAHPLEQAPEKENIPPIAA